MVGSLAIHFGVYRRLEGHHWWLITKSWLTLNHEIQAVATRAYPVSKISWKTTRRYNQIISSPSIACHYNRETTIYLYIYYVVVGSPFKHRKHVVTCFIIISQRRARSALKLWLTIFSKQKESFYGRSFKRQKCIFRRQLCCLLFLQPVHERPFKSHSRCISLTISP